MSLALSLAVQWHFAVAHVMAELVPQTVIAKQDNTHYHIVRLIIHSKRKAEQFGLLNPIIRLVMNNKANNGNY